MARIDSAAGLENPLQKVFPQPIISKRAPKVTDKRYPIGQVWIDQPNRDIYTLTAVPSTGAVWSVTSLGSEAYPETPYVVGPAGSAGYQTIQSALDAANAAGGGKVHVQGGTYTEDLTLYANIALEGASQATTVIIGQHTPPDTGIIQISDLNLSDNDAILSSASAGSSVITLMDCITNVTTGTAFDLANWSGILRLMNVKDRGGTADNGINMGGGTVIVEDSTVGAQAGATASIGGSFFITGSTFQSALTLGPGNGGTIEDSAINGEVTIGATATVNIYGSRISSGASPALTMSSSNNCILMNSVIDSANSPSIDGSGAGDLKIAGVDFVDNSEIAGTLTPVYADSISGVVKNTQLQTQGGQPADFIGQATLVAGVHTIINTNVTANDRVFMSRASRGSSTVLGVLQAVITPGVDVVISSRDPGTPANVETGDLSIVNYWIVREI